MISSLKMKTWFSPLVKIPYQSLPSSHAHLACAAIPFFSPFLASFGLMMRPSNSFPLQNLLQLVGLP